LFPLKNILVPYDGSRYSESALQFAIEMAKACGSVALPLASVNSTKKRDVRIILLNVLPEVYIPEILEDRIFHSLVTGERISTREYIKEFCQQMKKEHVRMMDPVKEKIESSGISAKYEVLLGYPADTIIEYAKTNKIDLIVMGTAGLRGISRIRSLGSVARSVAERSPCPVTLVH